MPAMDVFVYLVKKRKPDHQLSMPIGSQRCDTKKGGECEKGHKDESRALFGKIWEGFKTICVLDCVCVCVFIPAWVGFLVLYITKILVSMYFQVRSDWFS